MDNLSILEIQDLAVSYKTRKGAIQAVRDVSFDIHQGESLGLVGESGCGKSTVAFTIVNFLGPNGRVDAGSIRFKGQELRGRSEKDLRRLRGGDVAMVYQEPLSSLNPSMRIEDQLAEALIAHQGVSREDSHKECIEVLERVRMSDVETILRRYPHQLSGGQQQRVLIAMALLNNPALLIMDEPTTALDVTVEAAVLDLIAELQKAHNTATLYISHNLGVVARIADKVAVMYAGEIVERAPTEVIFKRALHPYTVGLMRCLPDVDAPKGTRILQPIPGQVPAPDKLPPGCIFSPRCRYRQAECSESRIPLRQAASGHWVRCLFAEEFLAAPPWEALEHRSAEAQPEGEVRDKLLKADNLRVYYPVAGQGVFSALQPKKRKYVKAVDDVSIQLRRGWTLGVVGESGCGKSTLARALVGLEPLKEGEIEFMGLDISLPLRKRTIATIRELQMVFQNPDGVLNPSYTIGNQIAMPLRRFKVVPPDQVYNRVVQLLRSVKLDESYYRRFPRQLSGGEKQRVGIARAIAASPSVLVCDEPVSSLDVSVQASIVMLLSEIQEQHNMSMILISHDLSTVRFLSNYVVVMYLGRIVEEGPSERIYSPPFHPYTAALMAAVPRPNASIEPAGFRLSGTVPSAVNPPQGCCFHTRCPLKIGEICEVQVPPVHDLGGGHKVYCHLPVEALPRK